MACLETKLKTLHMFTLYYCIIIMLPVLIHACLWLAWWQCGSCLQPMLATYLLYSKTMKAEGSVLGPLLFLALVREDRPSSVIHPENSFCWHMIVKSPHQFFTPCFHDVLHRLTLQFPLPAVQATFSVSRRCEVWKNGIK